MNQVLRIFFADDSEYMETNSIDGGSRNDVLVQIKDQLYHPSFYDIFSLKQDFDRAIAKNQVYEIDNTIILVKEVSKKEIIRAVISLYESNFFDKVKPIDLKEEFKDSFILFPELQTLSGWKQVY